MWGAILLFPFGVAQAPGQLPSWEVIASIAALGLLGTFIGQLLYFRLVYDHGSARAALVVYLLPVTALFYGAFFLDEPITVQAIIGLVLILIGTALGSGLLLRRRRTEPVPASP